MDQALQTHTGQCHCGVVSFTFTAPSVIDITQCDCSICSMTGYQHVFVTKGRLDFISGEDNLKVYTFNTGAAQHMFCKTCGIKPLYVPRSHPDSYSVNLRCVTSQTLSIGKTIQFCGKNWEDNIAGLRDET